MLACDKDVFRDVDFERQNPMLDKDADNLKYVKLFGLMYVYRTELLIMKDMDVLEFARKISMLTLDTPLSMEFDKQYGQKENCWWACQREHITVWCLHYPTDGVKGFEHKPSNSSKDMYNHFGRPETLLWLAEALGENNKVIQDVIDEIKDKRANSACAIIRRHIPYDRIIESLEKQ